MPRRRDYALVVLGAVLWGAGGLTGAALADATGMGSAAVGSARLLVGGGVLLVALVGGAAPTTWRARVLRRLVVVGLLAGCYQACYFAAVSLAGVTTATLVALGAAPVIAATVTAADERRAPGRRLAFALGCAVVGLVLLVGMPSDVGRRPMAGAALALVAASAFAAMTMVNARAAEGPGPLAGTGVSFTVGGLLLLPVAALAGSPLLPADGHGWLLLALLGLGPTAAAYGVFFTGLRSIPATTATVVALLEPLTAAVGAVVLLHQPVTAPVALGGAGLLAAVLLLRPVREPRLGRRR
jgi:DME family drug/metabolite transporter